MPAEIENDLPATKNYVFQVGVDNDENDRINSELALNATTTGLQLHQVSTSTRDDAQAAITRIDNALEILNGQHATLGAMDNRFARLSVNQGTMVMNETEHLSILQDADFSESSTSFASEKLRIEVGSNVMRLHRELQGRLVEQLLQAVAI